MCLTIFYCHFDHLLNGEVPHGVNVGLEVSLPETMVCRVFRGLKVVGKEARGKQEEPVVRPRGPIIHLVVSVLEICGTSEHPLGL